MILLLAYGRRIWSYTLAEEKVNDLLIAGPAGALLEQWVKMGVLVALRSLVSFYWIC